MTSQLPAELEDWIRARVQSGQFSSGDAAVAEAAHRFRQSEQEQDRRYVSVPMDVPPSDPLLGCMRFDAELMDEIVADAYRQRREEPWRERDV